MRKKWVKWAIQIFEEGRNQWWLGQSRKSVWWEKIYSEWVEFGYAGDEKQNTDVDCKQVQASLLVIDVQTLAKSSPGSLYTKASVFHSVHSRCCILILSLNFL